MRPSIRYSMALIAGSTISLAAMTGCKNGASRGQSDLARWVDSPTAGATSGTTIQIPDLGVKFEIPDTLYVYKACSEAVHSPEGAQKWIPVVRCKSSKSGVFDSDSEESESSGDGAAEPIDLTIYVTHKSRPLDERAV